MTDVKRWVWMLLVVGAVIGVLLVPVGKGMVRTAPAQEPAQGRDMSSYASDNPSHPLPLLFIHHSIGGQLLAARGSEAGAHCIYDSYPTGGGLRERLESAGYQVHEASYNSQVGHKTDMFDWPEKFATEMDKVLRVERQDQQLPEGQRNRIVMFKSCFPNTAFVGEGSPPGSAQGPALTVWNAKAALRAVLPSFARNPETLFVYFTAPPNAPLLQGEALWRVILKQLLGKPTRAASLRRSAELARSFNDWVVSPAGWLKDYPEHNVVVFDYYNILTGDGRSNLLAYPSRGGADAHPEAAGQERATKAFVPFLNRAVRYAGLVDRSGEE